MPAPSTSQSAARLPWRAVVAVLLWLGVAVAAQADGMNFKTLLMPGKLAAGHAKLESDCGNCHVSFAKQAQDRLCMNCHKTIAADIRDRRGLHGQLPPARAEQCSQCHSDHRGRDADITGLDRDTFDHAATGFALQGGHSGLACASCHRSGQKFRAASAACYACHQSDDRHRGALGQDCKRCHNPSGWRDARFDHNTTTFKLKGGHARVDCGSCHAGERYKNTPADCVACHAIDDVHRGRNGNDCQRCHNETRWKQSSFDHSRDTRFPLRGRHADAACESCHRAGKFDVKLDTACVACHRADDAHRGRNGDNCAACHSETGWTSTRFDHNRDTHFALRGKHADAACAACHRGDLHRALPRDCAGCHHLDDVHRGQEGTRCDRCHNESGWRQTAFKHDDTHFPLTGLHAVVPCDACHASTAFKGTGGACFDCHRLDDKHRGRLGAQCDRCHDSSGWGKAQFDHDRQTQFPLTGAHAGHACADCHREPADKVKLSTACYGCHARDDEHDGRFGRDCERCHNTTSFADVRMLH